MDIRPVPAEEPAARRFVEECWLPYNREFEATLEDFALAADVDLIEAELEHRLELLGSEDHRAWVAVEGGDPAVPLAETGGTFAGFVTTGIDECPTVFDRPDRLLIGDLYVREPHRGSGLARELVERAAERARATGCPEFTLEVDLGNERARAFYEKLGFEPIRQTMVAPVDGI